MAEEKQNINIREPTFWILPTLILLFIIIFIGPNFIKQAALLTLLLFAPTYFIIHSLKLGSDEKIIFSIFIGLGLMPAVIYWPSLLIGSIQMTAVLCSIILFAFGFAIKLVLKDKQHNTKNN